MIKKCEQCNLAFSVSEINEILKQKKPTGPKSLLTCSQCGTEYKPTTQGRLRLSALMFGVYVMSLSLDGLSLDVKPAVISLFRVLFIGGIYIKALPYFYTFNKNEA